MKVVAVLALRDMQRGKTIDLLIQNNLQRIN